MRKKGHLEGPILKTDEDLKDGSPQSCAWSSSLTPVWSFRKGISQGLTRELEPVGGRASSPSTHAPASVSIQPCIRIRADVSVCILIYIQIIEVYTGMDMDMKMYFIVLKMIDRGLSWQSSG